MPLGLDFLKHVVNVRWGGGGLHFLYSGADGMYGSRDGEMWEPAPAESSIRASSLAWVDGVWIGTGEGGTYRSTDGGKTWEPASEEFTWIVACKPEAGGTDAGGTGGAEGSRRGIFAAYKQDAEGEHEQIYISRDLGVNWAIELDIARSYDEEGNEGFVALSGCGNGIFVSTQKSDTNLSGSDAVVYSSLDGGGFTKQVVWQGITNTADSPGTQDALGYGPGGVGFDSETQQFCFTGLKQFSTGPVGRRDFTFSIIYATGSGGSFSGQTVIDEIFVPHITATYDDLSGGLGTCGGDGKFATTSLLRHNTSDFTVVAGDIRVHFVPGSTQVLMSLGNILDFDESIQIQMGPIVWRSHVQETSTDGTTSTAGALGTWCCVAFGPGRGGDGGVWTAKDGAGFAQTHAGVGFADDPFGRRAGLAVGKLSWLSRAQEPTA